MNKEKQKLEAVAAACGRMDEWDDGGEIYYKNVKEKNHTVDKDFMGKSFS
jgi:hypothetical protein